MAKGAAKVLMLAVLVLLGAAGLKYYDLYLAPARALDREKEHSASLQRIVDHLQSEHRVAELLMTERKTVNGAVKTTLLFQEYSRTDEPLPAKSFTVDGREIHLDAMVIKFQGKYVETNDALRGHSIGLFTRIFGDQQRPEDAAMIDVPGHVPAVYHGTDPRISDFERQLWLEFWKLSDDEEYRNKEGVALANGVGLWFEPKPGMLYKISIETNGGIHYEPKPVSGILGGVMKPPAAP